ncbi:MAG TPA: HNH endonuclease [Pyrinomonadaceae bacterium]|nr:HNH endonuclease [Pyrinomonadaceae bacterium]
MAETTTEEFHIDEYLFERQFARFRNHVIDKSGRDFVSFTSNHYTDKEEGYKYGVHHEGRQALGLDEWRQTDIGKGKILRSVIAAIELKESNLLKWQGRWGEKSKPHHKLIEALTVPLTRKHYEELLFRLYNGDDDPLVFDSLVVLSGRRYPVLSYLFFLKDRSRYMPIAPTFFDKAFEMLGANFVASHKCSWENYSTYNSLLLQTKYLLSEKLNEVSLLDAHSFAWMLATKLRGNETSDVIEYKALDRKHRKAIVNARIGQGPFRKRLIRYWGECAINGCKEELVLRASHIKPWADCDPKDATNPFNGLLLSPSFDAAFDAGLISFTDAGKILVSPALSRHDRELLGINSTLRLTRVDYRHRPYLEHHRIHKFKNKSV